MHAASIAVTPLAVAPPIDCLPTASFTARSGTQSSCKIDEGCCKEDILAYAYAYARAHAADAMRLCRLACYGESLGNLLSMSEIC
jgi:hypothetical protein